MLGLHLARADIQRGACELVNSQQLETYGGADDIHNRIYGAYFVEMNLFERHSVDFGFGFGQAGEDFVGAFGGTRCELGFVDSLQNYGKAAVVVGFGGRDLHLCRINLAALYLGGGNIPCLETEFA